MRVEDLTTFEGECPIIVVFSAYMDIRIPLTKKWKKIINEKEDKPNTYHNNLIDYISEQIELSGFNMKSIGNLLIKKIVFNENNYYRYNNIEGFPITINDLGYWDKNGVRLNEDFHTVRLFNTVSVKDVSFAISLTEHDRVQLLDDDSRKESGSETYYERECDALFDINGRGNTERLVVRNPKLRNLLKDGEYIPSLRQLNLMAHYKDSINDALKYIGAEPLASAWFWSSTESSQYNAWYVYFFIGDTGSYSKYGSGRVRTVIDF